MILSDNVPASLNETTEGAPAFASETTGIVLYGDQYANRIRICFTYLFTYGWDIMAPEMNTYKRDTADRIVEELRAELEPVPDDAEMQVLRAAWHRVCVANGWDENRGKINLDD